MKRHRFLSFSKSFLFFLSMVLLLSLAESATAGWNPMSKEKAKDQGVSDSEVAETIAAFKNSDPDMKVFFDKAYGFAVFPTIGKGGFGIGGAYGKGKVYKKGKLIGTSSKTSAPSRVKSAWGLTRTVTCRSPAPPGATSPEPRRVRTAPSWTPAGTRTSISSWRKRVPEPLQPVQGVSTFLPVPRQAVQGRDTAKKPRCCLTCPRPAQVAHWLTLVPGAAPLPEQSPQGPGRSMVMFFSVPRAASTNSTSSS